MQSAPPKAAAPPPAASSSSRSTGGYQAPASLPSGTKIKVKCYYKDTRVVQIEDGITFTELSKRIQEKFDGTKLKLKYKDEDGDQVLLVDQDDMDMALSMPDAAAGKMELWCS